jgi:hypothetical protein
MIRKNTLDMMVWNPGETILNNFVFPEVSDEVREARSKCLSIKQIDGQPVRVVALTLEGEKNTEKIGITYVSEGQQQEREYKREDFYRLG